jgi:hypothetical protein
LENFGQSTQGKQANRHSVAINKDRGECFIIL